MANQQPRDAIVLVLDCSSSMKQPYGDDNMEVGGGRSNFDCAQGAIKLYLQQKMMLAPKDEIGLICFGTEATDNDCHDEKGGYDNIVAARDIHPPDMDFVRHLMTLDPNDNKEVQSELIDSIVVAVDMLTKKTSKKKYSKTIFVFSDGNCRIDAEEDSVAIVNFLNESEVALRFVGIGICGDKVTAEADKESNDALSNRQREIEKFIGDFCEKCNDGHVLNATHLLEMLSVHRPRAVLQTSKCRLDLEMTPFMKIPSWVYILTKEEPIPTLKSLSSAAPKGSEGRVRMERSYFPVDQVDQEDVVPEDRIKAHAYGKQLVPVTAADTFALKYESGERRLVTLGSVNRLERQMMLANVECVAAEPNNPQAARAMFSLAAALNELNMALVCNYVWRKNAAPRLVILTPPSSQKSCLYLNYMPFKEDIRPLVFPSLPKVTDPEQLRAVGNLVDSMNLMPSEDSEVKREILKPRATFNPTLQRFYQFVMLKALNEEELADDAAPPCEASLERLLDVDQRIRCRSRAAAEQMQSAFTLKKAERGEGPKRKRLWRDYAAAKEAQLAAASVNLEKLTLGEDEEGEEQQPAVDGDAGGIGGGGNLSMTRIAEIEGMTVGTVRPIADFEAMMAVKEMDISSNAIRQMTGVIDRLISESLGTQLHQKAVDCVESLRRACVKDKEGNKYNTYLEKLRVMCESRGVKNNIWQTLQKLNLTLVSLEEDHNSTVTAEEAKRYFSPLEDSATASTHLPGTATAEDEDDLLDLIE